MSKRVLLIEDDQDTLELLSEALRREGFDCDTASTGQEGLARQRTQPPQLVILDLMLPDMDGFDVCRQIRTHSTVPLMMVTGKDDLIDRVVGFEVGADEYLVKPFGTREFTARAHALLRRVDEYAEPIRPSSVLDFGEVRVDQEKHEVVVRGEPRHFTKKEFELLLCLAENEGRVMRSSDLLKRIWDYDDSIRSRTLDVHIGRVRAKIERRPNAPQIIVTVPCIGYKFVSPQTAA
ncbi:MAG: response regulator transcription factor [Armatimonadetes bacterium]|nr:response regulator transcription factor [Armatimonadota bacterium]